MMHWIRIDRYYQGSDAAAPDVRLSTGVMCQQLRETHHARPSAPVPRNRAQLGRTQRADLQPVRRDAATARTNCPYKGAAVSTGSGYANNTRASIST